MPKASKEANQPTHVTRGNVLEDLGLSRTELMEAKVKSDLWRDLIAHIKPMHLNQTELAARLGVYQPEISHLLNGKLSKFSVGTLIHYGAKLDLGFQGKFLKPKAHKSARLQAQVSGKQARSEGPLTHAGR